MDKIIRYIIDKMGLETSISMSMLLLFLCHLRFSSWFLTELIVAFVNDTSSSI